MIKTILFIALLLPAPLLLAATSLPLSAWNNTPVRQAIETWITAASTPGNPDFIPPAQRYVVFDNDGTLWPEAPMTFQLQFALNEVKRLAPQHPEWQRDAILSAALKNDLPALAKAGKPALSHLVAVTHSNMTTDQFDERVRQWLDQQRHPRFGCRYDQLGYLPMRQLLDALRMHGFKTWIVSGGGIDFMRVMAEKMYGIPPEQVVGSFSLSEFVLTADGTTLRKTMKGAFYDDEAMKPVAIHLFIGHRPVAAFGNSDGDVPMLQYTSANTATKTFGLLVHHTDAEREYAYDSHPPASGKLVLGLTLAPRYGWTIVDMKRDWKQVFDPALCPQ
jgi:phosphoglycolate phosphatase-like HAD superfamily hydrolase